MAKDNYHILYESHIEDNKKAKNALSAAKAVESKIKKKYVLRIGNTIVETNDEKRLKEYREYINNRLYGKI